MSLLKSIAEDEKELKRLQDEEAGKAKGDAEDGEEEEELEEEEETSAETDDEEGDEGEKEDKKDAKVDKKADKVDDKSGKVDKKDEVKLDKDGKPVKKNDLNARLRISEKIRKDTEKALEAERQKKAEPAKAPEKTAEEKAAEAALTPEQRVEKLENELAQERETKQKQELYRAAIDEFNDIEKEFEKATPDYEPASTHMLHSMVDGVMKAYPSATEKQALAHVQQQILNIASKAVKNGQNPVEVLYNMAYERYGYNPRAPKKDEAKKEIGNLKNREKNKKRSASGVSGGGQSSNSSVSLEEGANMSLANFSNLSEKEIDDMILQASRG